MQETESDLLFSARLRGGRPLFFYVLLEHQSKVSRWMALRMLRYVVRQLEHWRTMHPEAEQLPVIIPLVLYHGPEGVWSAPRRVEDLFDLARLALLVLRYGRTAELAERLRDWAALFAQVHMAPNGFEQLGAVVHYLLLVGDRAVKHFTVEMLHSVMGEQRAEELMRTYGEELIEQGRQKGRLEGQAEGLARGRAEGVLRILDARCVYVPASAQQRILSCTDLTTLDQWFDRALTATRLADVLGDLAQ